MDDSSLHRMIAQLRGDLEEIRYAIWALESIAAGKPRRGRPPKWISKVKGTLIASDVTAVIRTGRTRS